MEQILISIDGSSYKKSNFLNAGILTNNSLILILHLPTIIFKSNEIRYYHNMEVIGSNIVLIHGKKYIYLTMNEVQIIRNELIFYS